MCDNSYLDGHSGAAVRTQQSLVLTVPAFNEEATIERCVRELVRLSLQWDYITTIIVAEDGSTDRTREILSRLQTEFPEIRVLVDREKRGRGFAIRRAWSGLVADIFAFTDADLPAGVEGLTRVVKSVGTGREIATGSRYAAGAVTVRPPLRSFVSRRYNGLLRVLFRETIRDHQCGVKAFAFTAVNAILPIAEEESWFWDTEALVLATRMGLNVVEVPVTWRETKYARTSLRRLAADVWLHGWGVLRLFIRSGGPVTSRGSRVPTSVVNLPAEFVGGGAEPQQTGEGSTPLDLD